MSLMFAGFLAACAASCSQAPEARQLPEKRSAAEPAERSRPADAPERSGNLPEKVFFNLAPVSLSNVTGEGVGSPGSLSTAQAGTPAWFHSLPDTTLVEELRTRWSHELTDLAGGVGATPGESSDEARLLSASRQVLALALVRGDHDPDDPVLREALEVASRESAGDDHRLLAAAFLAHSGHTADASRWIATLTSVETRPPTAERDAVPSTAVEHGSFEVSSLTFARSIEGPGKFTPADPREIAPEKTILLYGEFRNFKNFEEAKTSDRPASYRRAFAASLRLLGPADQEIDKLDFLPEKRGRQLTTTPADVMNFWARYRIPSLEPGTYRLVVEARDVLGKMDARGEISFAVPVRAARPRTEE